SGRWEPNGVGQHRLGGKQGFPQDARTMQNPCAQVNTGMGMAVRLSAHLGSAVSTAIRGVIPVDGAVWSAQL
ncbi:hypothetical protein, partial [Azospirillum formosense]|uniref:hypothetical protein n=1 Tax=Azospirillum formosense TaxID=861533 RepID=UPI001B3C07C3